MFDTKQFPDKLRTQEYNGLYGFSECEVCGAREPLYATKIRYCHRARKIMCDRCIDNFDGITPWSDEHARKFGLPPYPNRREVLDTASKLRRIFHDR